MKVSEVKSFIREQGKVFPHVENPKALKILKVWGCKYVSLSAISDFANLEKLEIGPFPDNTLDILTPLKKLRYLRIWHMPKVNDLSALEQLISLESLSLETMPSWDASGKVQEVTSLQPIQRLKNLKHLHLFGVRSKDKSLKTLYSCKNLEMALFSKYPKKEIEDFYEITKVRKERMPDMMTETK